MLLVQLISARSTAQNIPPCDFIGWLLPLCANQHLDNPTKIETKIGENVLNFWRKVLHKKIYNSYIIAVQEITAFEMHI